MGMLGSDSLMRMERKNFNYKKELKALFSKTAQAYGALGLDEEEKEMIYKIRNKGKKISFSTLFFLGVYKLYQDRLDVLCLCK